MKKEADVQQHTYGYKEEACKYITKWEHITKRFMTIGGVQDVPVANLPYTLTSDAGHAMCNTPYDGTNDLPPFAACYWDTPEGRVFSLRSVGNFDVSEIAKKYGGGGHKNAAGFRIPTKESAAV